MVIGTLGWLLVLHAISDFPLQGDFLARAKNHSNPIPGVPWLLCLSMHALISAGAVALVMPVPFAVAEFFVHGVTDWAKNEGLFGTGERAFLVDQAIHVASKAAWWLLR